MKNIQFLLEVIDNKVIYNVNLIAIFIKENILINCHSLN
jgi:hypothetical protein